jgi:HEAT repeat protein
MRTISLCIFALLGSAGLAFGQPPTLESKWADLASPDDVKATRALLALAATPKETVEFLKENLKAVKADPKQVEQLIKQLDSANFIVRSKAMAELEYYGKYVKADLEAALKSNAGVETRLRIQQLIDKMPSDKKPEPPPAFNPGGGESISVMNVNGQITILVDGKPINLAPSNPPPPPGPPAQWLRAGRAALILEHLGTPEAQAILQSLASGESDALPTRAAREALDRMKKN